LPPADPSWRERKPLSFPHEEYAGRLERVRNVMAREGIDLLYLTAPKSMCYISGYRHFDAPEHMDAIENETVATDARVFSSNSDNPADGFV
jgi:Xaa-Pro aminopeptidase